MVRKKALADDATTTPGRPARQSVPSSGPRSKSGGRRRAPPRPASRGPSSPTPASAHAGARPSRPRDEVADRRLLEHLRGGGRRRVISASACALPRASAPSTSSRVRSQRGADHREDGARILFPARRRQLGFAHGAISVQLEEALEGAPRRPLGIARGHGRVLARSPPARQVRVGRGAATCMIPMAGRALSRSRIPLVSDCARRSAPVGATRGRSAA